MNITQVIKKYAISYYTNSGTNPSVDDIDKAYAYLRKYAIDEDEYCCQTLQLFRKVFRNMLDANYNISSIDIASVFRSGFQSEVHVASPIFSKETYLLFQEMCSAYGDRMFYILEDELCEEDTAMVVKLKFPVSTTWNEIMSGEFLSNAILRTACRNYYMFGDSGKWGRWCDYDNNWLDYEIMGYSQVLPETLRYCSELRLSDIEKKRIDEDLGIPKSIIKYLR